MPATHKPNLRAEKIDVRKDIKPFARFVGWLVEKGLMGMPVVKV